jgi:hypothetical protein
LRLVRPVTGKIGGPSAGYWSGKSCFTPLGYEIVDVTDFIPPLKDTKIDVLLEKPVQT